MDLRDHRSILTKDRRLLREAYYEMQFARKGGPRGAPQIKAVAINPMQPEYIAVAANDPLIRVYDRRMLSLSSDGLGRSEPAEDDFEERRRRRQDIRHVMPCDVYLPSTLWGVPFEFDPHWERRFSRLLTVTHLSWSPDGRLLGATYSGEQVYVFPFRSSTSTLASRLPPSYEWTCVRSASGSRRRRRRREARCSDDANRQSSSSSSASSSLASGSSPPSSSSSSPSSSAAFSGGSRGTRAASLASVSATTREPLQGQLISGDISRTLVGAASSSPSSREPGMQRERPPDRGETHPSALSFSRAEAESEGVSDMTSPVGVPGASVAGDGKYQARVKSRYASVGFLPKENWEQASHSSTPTEKIKEMQAHANQLLRDAKYTQAIVVLTQALNEATQAELRVPLLCNRALGFIKRAARGDGLAAELDAIEAACLASENPKPLYRRIQALRLSRRPIAAFRVARNCARRFPEIPDFARVMKEISKELCRSRRVSQLYGGSGIRPFPGCLCPSPLNSPRYFRRSPSTERDSRAAEATGDATQNQERRGDERNSETRTGPDEETREISALPPTTSSSWSASASCSSAPSSSAPSSLLHDAATAPASDEGQTGDARSTSSAAVGRMDGAESQERSGGEEGSNCRSGGDTDKPKALYEPSRPNHEERTQGTSLASPVSETTNDEDTDRMKARGLDTRFSETTVKRPPLQSGLMICLGSNNGDDVSCKDPSMHQTLRHSPPSSSSSPCALSASSSPCSTSTSSLCSTSASTSPCATSASSSPCGTSTSSSSATSSSLCSTSASSSCSTSASASSSSASSSSRPSPTRPSPPPSSLESCSKSEKRDLRVKQCEKDMESLLSLAFVYLEHSEEATRPLWLHPAVGFSYRCRIPRWQGWPSLSFLRRLIRSKCRAWLMERKEHPRRIEEGEEEEGDEATSELEAWKGDEENRDLGSTGRRSTGHGAGQLGRKEAREASGDFENVEDECHGNERSGIDKADMLRRQGRNKRQASRFSPQDSPLSASSNCGATAGATSTASVNLKQQTADKDVKREPRPSSHRKSKRLRSGSSSSSFSSFSSSTSSSASSFSSTASSSSTSFSSFSSSSSSSSASSSSASSSAAFDRGSFTVAQKRNEGASHPENAGPGGGVRRPAGAFLGRRFSRSALDALDEPVSFSESSSDGESRFDIDAYNSDVALDEYCLLCSTGEDAQSGPDGGSDSSEDSDAQAANAPQRREAAERRPGQSEGAEPEAALTVVGRSSGVADAAAGSQAGRCGEEPTAETEPREETPETEPREEETRTRACAEETAATGPGGEELSPADPEGDMRAERRVSMSQAIRERRREPGRDGGGSRSSESDGSAGGEAASLRDDAQDSHDSDDDLEEFGSSSSDSSWPSFGEEENVSDAPRRRYFWDDSDDDVWPDVDSMHDVGAAPGPWRLPFRTARQAEQYILNANWMPTPHIGRFVGHCNAATDIKEVAFWGTNHVLAGSDDASVLAWRMCDGEVVNILRGHESHVNCVAVHPHGSCIATSGIDDFIKIWTPEGDSPFVLDEAAEKVLRSNQDLMDEENAAARSLFTTFRPGILRHLFASMDRPGEGDREPACNIQ